MKKITISLLSLCALGAWTACVDADLQDALDEKDTYTNAEDADYHILGIYSQFMQLAEQMVVLNELRGDLMTITPNANEYLQQVEANKYNAENPYFSAQPYYSVIANCNDANKNGVSRVHILDGRKPHSLLLEVFTDTGIGTMFFRDDDKL